MVLPQRTSLKLATIYLNGHVPKVEGVPISGLAVSFDEARRLQTQL